MKRTALARQAPHPWPFSHGVVVEGAVTLVFLAGQVAYDRHGPNRQVVGVGDPAAQTRQAIQNVRRLLRQAGGDLEDIVEMTAYVTDVSIMEAAGRVAQEYFRDPLPAMSFVGVRALARPEFLIEIRAIAALEAAPRAGGAPPRSSDQGRTARRRPRRPARRRRLAAR